MNNKKASPLDNVMRQSLFGGPALTPDARSKGQTDDLLSQALNAYNAGQFEVAEALCDQVLSGDETNSKAWGLKGLVNYQSGMFDEAIEMLLNASRLISTDAELFYSIGTLQQEMGKYEDAIDSFQASLAINPDNHIVFNSLAGALMESGNPREALKWFLKAVTVDPANATLYYNVGILLLKLQRHAEAVEAFITAVTLKPDWTEVWGLLIYELQRMCNWNEYDVLHSQLGRLFQKGLYKLWPFQCLTLATTTAMDHLRCSQMHATTKQVDSAPYIHKPPLAGHPRKIRVGYISWDFHQHATSYLMAELFGLHDRTLFEIFVYAYGPDDGSAIRARIKNTCDHFVDIQALSHPQAAARIFEDGVDILVDLKGYTHSERSNILAYRPAPIQVNWLGYPGSMGAPFIDYIIADRFIIPDGHEQFYTEQVVRLPETYQINDRQREIAEHTPSRAEWGLPEKGFVFCCFNQGYKITPEMFDVWMRLLQQTPGSVLWLLEWNEWMAGNLRAEAGKRGADAERLVFAPRLPLHLHLARYRHADLFIDTAPVGAHTTASDALWAGLPVLALVGDSFISRVAGSLLHAAGLPELVTDSVARYEQRALELAQNPQALVALRRRLEENRLSVPLFDSPRFTRHLERAYQAMYTNWQLGQPPTAIEVEPIIAATT